MLKRRFIRKFDFITTSGYMDGANGMERVGLTRGLIPYGIITQLGIYNFNKETKRLTLLSIHLSVTFDKIQSASSFKIPILLKFTISLEPLGWQLKIL